jgi:hypothetical protein
LRNITCNTASSRKRESSCRAVCRASRNANVGVHLSASGVRANDAADLKTISRFAQLEYKLGEPERGRTIFEGMIDSHPKRLDLWSVYIDMEATQQNIVGVRYDVSSDLPLP